MSPGGKRWQCFNRKPASPHLTRGGRRQEPRWRADGCLQAVGGFSPGGASLLCSGPSPSLRLRGPRVCLRRAPSVWLYSAFRCACTLVILRPVGLMSLARSRVHQDTSVCSKMSLPRGTKTQTKHYQRLRSAPERVEPHAATLSPTSAEPWASLPRTKE